MACTNNNRSYRPQQKKEEPIVKWTQKHTKWWASAHHRKAKQKSDLLRI
jgi:hypothetical protein